jgi:hypothetical protein
MRCGVRRTAVIDVVCPGGQGTVQEERRNRQHRQNGTSSLFKAYIQQRWPNPATLGPIKL